MFTACMIVRNESTVLARCLSSLDGIASRVCVVDSGSRDDTVEIARGFGAEVRVEPTLADADGRMLDFSAARNAALQMADTDWVLTIDADEVLQVENLSALRDLLGEPALQACDVRIRSSGSRWYLPRLFRVQPWTAYHGRVHEWVEVRGRKHRTDDLTITNLPDKRGKENGAERDLRLCAQILTDDPNDFRAILYIGRALRMVGRHREAIHYYEKYIRESKFDPGRYTAAIGAAISCLLSSDYEGARGFGLCALGIHPKMAEACCVLGDAVFALGELDAAREWFDRASHMTPPGRDYAHFVDESCYAEYPRERLVALESLTAGPAIDGDRQSGEDLPGKVGYILGDRASVLDQFLSQEFPRPPRHARVPRSPPAAEVT